MTTHSNDVDIDHPFRERFLAGRPGATPRAAYTAHQSIQAAISALAETGQVRVWTLQRHDEDYPSGTYVTLRGAIFGAVSILADELVPAVDGDTVEERIAAIQEQSQTPFGEIEHHSRLKYQGYLANEVSWEILAHDEVEFGEVNMGGYLVRTSYGDTSYLWKIVWSEVLP
jgi:hypothetical protein